jgi:hypothetical protein
MLVHIVMWRLHDQAPNGKSRAENASELQRRFAALVGVIPGLRRCELGIDISKTAESGDIVLYSEFDSAAALDAYQIHPLHLEIGAILKDARSERRVVDYLT